MSHCRSRSRLRVSRALLICLTPLLFLPLVVPSSSRAGIAIFPAQPQTTALTLLSQPNSTRAIALDSVTSRAEPFPVTAPVLFGTDTRTRVMLFATNLTLNPGENASAVTADAEDAARAHYPLAVEFVGAVPDFPG
jgi:hypothetical protein